MPRPIRSAVLALAVLVGVLSPSAAQAERWAGGDARKDVQGWHSEPEPEPCGTDTELDSTANADNDIVRLVVQHTRTEVRLVLRFRDLDPALEQSASFHFSTPRGGWWLDIERYERFDNGKWRVMSFLAQEPDYPDPDEIDNECGFIAIVSTGVGCRTHPQVDLDANEIRASVPRSCLRNPRWVRVGASSSGWTEGADPEIYDFFSDEWGQRKDSTSPYLPPFGPRVKAPAGSRVGGPVADPPTIGGELHRVIVRPQLP